MRTQVKVGIILVIVIMFLLAWAPWLNDQVLHDKILQEKGRKDGTIVPENKVIGSEEVLQGLLEESRKKGVVDGILICDYNVMWFPFGRYAASCEGGYFVTFWGEVFP